MNTELFFYIEKKDIYLEQILVDYMNVPIFFLCKDDKQYYLALCSNMDELNYIVVQISLTDTYNLLHGKIAMRDVFLKQEEYWEIFSGDEISLDIVTKHSIQKLNTSVLPKENACFEVLTKDIKTYVQNFDNKFFRNEDFYESDKDISLNELSEVLGSDLFKDYIEEFTSFGTYTTSLMSKSQTNQCKILYQENVEYTNDTVTFQYTQQTETWNIESSDNIAA